MKVYCCVCARQITKNQTSNKYETPLPATHMGLGTYACANCSRDLDENGMYPEERSQL